VSITKSDFIHIKGAKVHNLKNVELKITKNKLTVITGLSGSGKSSLAFDTLYAEGQRRYIESLSSYARQFMGRLNKPKVDFIKGLAPAIAVQQKVNTSNPRSTVGTKTEIYDYLKLLFARIGKQYIGKFLRNNFLNNTNKTQNVNQPKKSTTSTTWCPTTCPPNTLQILRDLCGHPHLGRTVS
jgi:excinuclease ABC subunit A